MDLNAFAESLREEARRRWGDVPITVDLNISDDGSASGKAFHTFDIRRSGYLPNIVCRVELLDDGNGNRLERAREFYGDHAERTLRHHNIRDDGWTASQREAQPA